MVAEVERGPMISARLDARDHIIAADDLILRLQRAAGGLDTGRIAIPGVAAVARLTRRLKIAVTRPLLIGGRDYDIRLWVRAYPVADGVALDFSDWQQAPHEGQDFEALRTAQTAMAAGGLEWRTDARICFVETAMKVDFASVGKPFWESFVPDGAQADAVSAVMANHQPFFGMAATLALSGEEVSLSGYPLYDSDGAFLGYHGWLLPPEDQQTEDGKAEDDRAEDGVPPPDDVSSPDADAGLPDFGRRLDRALRQPLGRIIANAETIREQRQGPLRSDYASYAADIAHAGRHLLELVDDLADLQAIDRAGFKVVREAIDLADLGRRAAGLLGVKAADRHIRISAPQGDEKAPAVGEFRRALQIIVNLLNNAIRYSPENSTIHVEIAHNETSAQITITDEGPGIEPENQERIFEKFERLGRTDVIGSGLGLYISRRLARAMQGDIVIESIPGQGARFTLWLPVE